MTIALKKIKRTDFEIIQLELQKFIRSKIDNMPHCKDYTTYCNDIIIIDTLQSMFYIFRSKLESNKEVMSLSLTPTQSVILLFCCGWETSQRDQETRIVMQMLSDTLHEKLVNL